MHNDERSPDFSALRHRSKFTICPLAPKQLRAEDAFARGRLGRRLAEERRVSILVYNTTRPIIDNSLITAKIADWQFTPGLNAQRIIGARLVRDYRCIMEALFSGYFTQAATLASGLFEAALDVRYIGNDKDRQARWFEHRDPTRKPWKLKTVYEELHKDFPEMQDWYAQTYKYLCLFKHGNPVRWDAAFDDPTIFDDELRVNAGPNADRYDDDERRAIFVLTSHHILRAFQPISRSFQKYHMLRIKWPVRVGNALHRVLHYIEDNLEFRVTH